MTRTTTGADVNRREFLAAGTAGLLAASAGSAATGRRDRAVIHLMLTGGPSQLETWDPRPDAPAEVRGPLAAIQTRIPGVLVSEAFPRLALLTDKIALLRTMHHDEAPIHETGQQLLQCGRTFETNDTASHYGAVVAHLLGGSAGLPAWVGLPKPLGNLGVRLPNGQERGPLPSSADIRWPTSSSPAALRESLDTRRESARVREAYGETAFSRSCLQARRLVEAGVRVVTVNMFDTVFDALTWDAHADGPRLPATLEDYRATLGPTFDRAFAALITDLAERGMLDDVLVLATGEFGRTPTVNRRGGRDHWPGVWTVLAAGGGIRGGQVIGRSDANAAYPADRPISPAALVATVYASLGIDPRQSHPTTGEPLVVATPIGEVFR